MSTIVVLDAASELNRVLNAKYPSMLYHQMIQMIVGPANIEVAECALEENLVFDLNAIKPIPERVVIISRNIRACADVNVNTTIGINFKVIKGWRATKTQTISNTSGGKVSGSLSIAGYGSLGAEIRRSQEPTATPGLIDRIGLQL